MEEKLEDKEEKEKKAKEAAKAERAKNFMGRFRWVCVTIWFVVSLFFVGYASTIHTKTQNFAFAEWWVVGGPVVLVVIFFIVAMMSKQPRKPVTPENH